MPRVCIGGRWPTGPRNDAELLERCRCFSADLHKIDPLFSEIAPTGSKNGFRNMLRQPLVASITEEEWDAAMEDGWAKSFLDITFWNRRTSENEFCGFSIHANDDLERNVIVVNRLPEALNNMQQERAVLAAMVTSFGLATGFVYTSYWSDDEISARYWLLWLRQGEPWPMPSPVENFNPAQGPYSSEEAWLGGTLYIWSQFEPWRYRVDG